METRSELALDVRYGPGTHERVVRLLSQPCISFARIAARFGVTREAVRRWHRALLPEAPTGHERQRLCRRRRQRQALLADVTFAAFYRHVRPVLAQAALGLIETRGGYRKRLVRLGNRLVFIKTARVSPRSTTGTHYVLTPYRGPADCIYYQLSADDFLLVPRGEVPAGGTSFADTPSSRYQAYRNTFDALLPQIQGRAAAG